MIKRCFNSFIYSSFFGMVLNCIIEMTVRIFAHVDYTPVTPEFVAYFPSYSMAMVADMLLYGLIGMTFSAMLFIYDLDKLGFVFQNMLYCLATGAVWIPIVTFIWQLHKYPQAIYATIVGFVVTYVIMTIVVYRTTKKNIDVVNGLLLQYEVRP